MALPATHLAPLTGDDVFDVMTTGYQWDLGASKTLNWSVSDGFLGEFWFNRSTTVQTFSAVFASIAPFVDVKFNYVGFHADPAAAFRAGSDLTMSLDGSNRYGSSTWAWAHFPNAGDTEYPGAPGDVFLNIFSQANSLPSYAPGSAGFALALHEVGHALGLKHPHDDGGTGGPTLNELGLGDFDKDWATVMSYQDDYPWNLLAWEPATYMVLDVLALQVMYGANRTTNLGNTTFVASDNGRYTTVWDAGGTDTVDASSASQAWTIVLPSTVLSSINGARVGYAAPTSSVSLSSPLTVQWLIGNIENATGSALADRLVGSDLDNVLRGGRGNDSLEGGNGTDTAPYSGLRSQYAVRTTAATTTVTDNVFGRDGVDTMVGVERLKFTDSVLALDINGNAGQAYRLYQAAFDRVPDRGGLTYWVNSMDHGGNLTWVAGNFILSNEFRAAYGNPQTLSNARFLDLLYANILDRAPDPGGKAYWLSELDRGFGRDSTLASFSESAENKVLVGTAIANGIVLDVL
jgi:serralysin